MTFRAAQPASINISGRISSFLIGQSPLDTHRASSGPEAAAWPRGDWAGNGNPGPGHRVSEWEDQTWRATILGD